MFAPRESRFVEGLSQRVYATLYEKSVVTFSILPSQATVL